METPQKIALVTGGSRGLGKDMALNLAKNGRNVILTYNTGKAEADAVVAHIERLDKKAIALQLNTGQTETFDAFFEQVKAALANTFQATGFDYLVNNAGVGA